MERTILSALLFSREAYEKLNPWLSASDFSGLSAILYGEIKKFYEKDTAAKSCDKEIIISRIERMSPKHADQYKEIVDKLAPVSLSNLHTELLEFKRYQCGLKLSSALVNGTKELVPLLQEYNKYTTGLLDVEKSTPKAIHCLDLREIAETFSEANLIKLSPRTLNEEIGGGVIGQTLIVVFGEPESGKSCLAINLAANWCFTGHRTLYIGNEEAPRKQILRLVSRLTGRTKQEILSAPEAAMEHAMQNGYNNLIYAPLTPGTFKEIESLVDEWKPKCIVVDQLRHISIPGAQSEQAQLSAAGAQFRALIKKHDMVGLVVHQGADSCTGKDYLTRGDCYMSNVSLPGDADILIGIGAKELRGTKRYLNLIKNKESNVHKSLPTIFNGPMGKVSSI